MRTTIILLFVCVVMAPSYAETMEAAKSELRDALISQYGTIEQSPLRSGILYDLVLPLSKLDRLSGGVSADTIDFRRFMQAAHELRTASLVEFSLPDYTTLQRYEQDAARTLVHPLLILDFRYQQATPGTIADEFLTRDSNGQLLIQGDKLVERSAFVFTAAYDRTYRGANTIFRFDSDQSVFSNQNRNIRKISVDFDDGLGLRDINEDNIEVHYPTTGLKTLRLRVEFDDGNIEFAYEHFDVVTLEAPTLDATWNLTADIPYLGQAATGDAYILLSPDHAVLTRPIVVTDGFDIGNLTYWDELYNMLNQQHMLDHLLDLGYDAVVFNYTDGTTYVQRNAYLVETLLDSIENVIPPDQEYVLVGPSMGGLITRFALSRMDSLGIPNRVRTWISMDSPHKGANIPLGAQYWVNFFSDLSTDAAMLRDALNSPAAKQMLIFHYTAPASAAPAADPLRQTMLNEFVSVGGYPSSMRTVAVCNGSSTMQGMTFAPGAQIILYEYNSFAVDIRGNIWALNNASSQQIFQGMIDFIIFGGPTQNVTVNATLPWDNAPGGTSNSMEQMGSVPAPYGDIIALHNDHCFIPSISALALNVTDPFYNIADDPNLYSLTPFDSLYFPVENQTHVEITAESYYWLLGEVLEPLDTPEVVITSDGINAQLSWQSVDGADEYRVYSTNDWNTWPLTFTAVADTFYSTAASDSMRFFRVSAERNIPPPVALAQTEFATR